MNYRNNDDENTEISPLPSPEKEIAEEQFENIRTRNIIETGAVKTHKDNVTIQTLIIAGQIEGHYALSAQTKSTKYEHILPQLVGVEENDDVDGLLVLLNTVGGDVEAGLAIAEMISGMSKPTVSLVLGGSHSIGVPLAVSANTSFIVPSATMTLHPVRMNGLVIGVPQAFAHFAKMQQRIIDFVTRNSRIEEAVLRKLILETNELATDIGSVIDGKQAVDVGLIDKVGSLSEALAELKALIRTEKQKRHG